MVKFTNKRSRRPNGTPIKCCIPWCGKIVHKSPRRDPITGNYLCGACGMRVNRHYKRVLKEHKELEELLEKHDWLIKYIDERTFFQSSNKSQTKKTKTLQQIGKCCKK